MGAAEDYRSRIESLLASLSLPAELISERGLTLQPEAGELALAGVGADGREHRLIPPEADAWRAMRAAARADGVGLEIVSAFRGVERQTEIVRHKLARGLTPEDMLYPDVLGGSMSSVFQLMKKSVDTAGDAAAATINRKNMVARAVRDKETRLSVFLAADDKSG